MLGSSLVHQSNVAAPALRLGVLFALSYLLFLVTYARLSQTLPSLGVALYGARLCALTAATVFAFSYLLMLLAHGTAPSQPRAPRCRWVSTLLFLVLLSPFIHYVSAHIASGDGLRALRIPELVTTSASLLVLSLLTVIVWTYRFWARPRVLDALFAILACSALLLSEAQLSRAQPELATLLQLFAVLLASQLVITWVGDDTRLSLRLGLASSGIALALVVLALSCPELVAGGRRRALVAESALAYVAPRLLGLRHSPQVPPKVDYTRCEALRAPKPAKPLPLAAEQRRNVILISIDTLRADYVGSRVAGKLVMPALVRFTEEARYAPRAQTAFPATLLAMTSAFTGYMPSDLLVAPKPIENLFSLTKDHVDVVEAVLPRGGYFSRPDVRAYLLSGADVVAAGSARQETHYALRRLRELRAAGKSHLMWLHYFEPHSPYQVQPPFEFGDSEVARYQSELAFVDEQLGYLLALLRDGGWYDDSLIMVFADHGESFGEHNHSFHHYLVYPWLVNVPLVFRTPGMVPARVDAPVHLMDVTASVLQFLGLPAPGALRGQSLLGDLPPASRALFSEELSISGRTRLRYRNEPPRTEAELFERLQRLENGPGYVSKLGVRLGDRYLVQHRASQAAELYALRGDPHATRDLAEVEPELVRALNEQAEDLRASVYERAACALEAHD
jgi:hypothetical protein